MDQSLFFKRRVHNQYIIFDLDDDKATEFLSSLPSHFRTCYIDDKQLLEKIRSGGNAEEILRHLIPDTGSVMAGDFGEILSFYLLQGKYPPKKLNGPKKWRWKTDRNKPSPKTDVVLFYIASKKSSPDDLLVIGESKVKATDSSRDPIADAIDGTKQDHVSRLAATLVWMRERAIVQVEKGEVNKLNRFIFSSEPSNGPYKKWFHAIAIIDRSFLENLIANNHTVPALQDEAKIVVIAIPNLKTKYETVFRNLPTSFGERSP